MKAKILLIEDDPGVRRALRLSLKTEGYSVLEADDGVAGVALACREAPDLVICDVNLPKMDGYAVVERLRQNPALASLPIIFLTARGERADVRRGMSLGADDYLTKPFTRAELLESIAVRLNKQEVWRETLTQQLIVGAERLRVRFRSRLTGEAEQSAIREPVQPDTPGSVVDATVLFTDIRGFTTISERLSAVEIAALLNAYFQRACEPILAAGGKVVKFIGDGIMAVFPHTDEAPRERQALRAVQAGLGLSIVAHGFRSWVQERYLDRALPEFAIGVGIHTGEVTLCEVGAPGQESMTAIGDTVNIASRLEGQTKRLGWPVVASGATIAAAGDAVVRGAHHLVHLRGRSKPVLVYEVVGLKNLPATTDRVTGNLPALLWQALAGNAESAATAAKAALRETLEDLMSEEADPSLSAPLRIKSYSVIGKVNSPSEEAASFLAERDMDGKKVAIEVRRSRPGEDPQALERSIQAASMAGRLEHPNVAAIYDHGFAEDLAYIVTEYFPAGSLRQLLTGPLAPRRALSFLAQAANGLSALHRHGSLHRGLQPENMMLRQSGEIALAGFEVASDDTENVPLHCLYYRSPESLRRESAGQASDLYALGVIFFEMLTGRRPYTGDSKQKLVDEILRAASPSLPPEIGYCQALVDGMLAKHPAQRYPSAAALLEAVDAILGGTALQPGATAVRASAKR